MSAAFLNTTVNLEICQLSSYSRYLVCNQEIIGTIQVLCNAVWVGGGGYRSEKISIRKVQDPIQCYCIMRGERVCNFQKKMFQLDKVFLKSK